MERLRMGIARQIPPELLQDFEKLLSRRPQTNLKAVFEILRAARGRRNIKKLARAKEGRHRALYVEAGLAKRQAAKTPLLAWRKWILTYDPIANDLGKKRIERIDRVLEDLRSFNPEPRIPKPIRPKDSETEELGRELAGVGVPRGFKGSKAVLERCAAGPSNLQTALLMAVGLIPYRPR